MDGILVVKKEKNYTSHDIVAIVKKITKTKVGHTGTLDPMATGVLPLLLGEGTKLSKYLIEHDKIYIATIKLGQKTDTQDAEGKVIEEKEVNEALLNEEDVKTILNNLKGRQVQTPPIYSAIKVNGKKLYDYARKNQEVEIPKREIKIYEMELIGINESEKTITFKVHCSKGTYIRSLCETISEKLETVGYMKELNRIKVGSFSENKAVTLEEIKENAKNKEFWIEKMITIEEFFKDKPKIILPEYKLKLFLNGVNLSQKAQNGIYRIYNEKNEFIGTGVINNNLLKREIVI